MSVCPPTLHLPLLTQPCQLTNSLSSLATRILITRWRLTIFKMLVFNSKKVYFLWTETKILLKTSNKKLSTNLIWFSLCIVYYTRLGGGTHTHTLPSAISSIYFWALGVYTVPGIISPTPYLHVSQFLFSLFWSAYKVVDSHKNDSKWLPSTHVWYNVTSGPNYNWKLYRQNKPRETMEAFDPYFPWC